MRILVTGGAGYIGGFTARRLLARGHTVTVYDNLTAGHRAKIPADNLVVGDLKDIDHLDHLLVVNRVDAVLHFAASTSVGESVTHPAKFYQNNLLNSLNLLERVRRHAIPRFVFSSTAAVYGTPERIPLTEDHPLKPVNPYGQTKLAFEAMLADYSAAYGTGVTVLRYFNAAGAAVDAAYGEAHDPETHLIPLVLYAALGKRPRIDIFGTDYETADGTCIRDYVHVEDLAEAHVLALEKQIAGKSVAYNVGSGTGNSVREVICTCGEVSGKTIPVNEAPRRAGDPPVLVASAEKLKRELGWSPKFPDLRSIVETAWDWHRKG